LGMTSLRIVADAHEAASGIPTLLKKKGVVVQMRTLDVGDYVIARYAVERKAVRDFIGSLYGGRLFEQASRISQSYDQFMLIVEGDSQEVLSDLKNPRVYWGTLLALSIDFNFRIMFTHDQEQTADLLFVLANRLHGRGKTVRPLLVKKPRLATTRDWQLLVLGGLPAIGPTLAEKLLQSFGTVRNVFRASRNELAVKGGIGAARAKRIQELIDAEYRSNPPHETKLL
jgi:DNA excision repair protein ERCC-4